MVDTQQMIEVMQAHVDGKVIESRWSDESTWVVVEHPDWLWGVKEYRVKDDNIVVDEIETIIYQTKDGVKHFTWEEACSHAAKFRSEPDVHEGKQPLTIEWEVFDKEYKWAAMDENGEIYAHEYLPEVDIVKGEWVSGGPLYFIDTHNGCTEHWKETLTKRPNNV